ncbi:MAG: hypothetical protein M9885_09545 [Burkholderiaceae bacterium]|nr:hypothetical protein [Burkholderiaceae bacterium]
MEDRFGGEAFAPVAIAGRDRLVVEISESLAIRDAMQYDRTRLLFKNFFFASSIS